MLFTQSGFRRTPQVRVCHTFTGGIWATIGSTAVVTANSAAAYLPGNSPEYFTASPGQVLNFISTSTSSGYVRGQTRPWQSTALEPRESLRR